MKGGAAKSGIGIKAKGSKELKKHKEGGKLTRRQAIHAKCYDCLGGYADGKTDCALPYCPLYPWMPYKGKKADSNEVTEGLVLT